jgi:3-isopropylmalate dehydrogenase
MKEAQKVLTLLAERGGHCFDFQEGLIGGGAYDRTGTPFPEETLDLAQKADAVLLGAVGGPQWDTLPFHLRPERALLGIREGLGLFANLRPLVIYPELLASSTLKAEVLSGVDIVIVRELTGDAYFGRPRGIRTENGRRIGINTIVYDEMEIARIAQVGFQLAQKRQKRLCSVDKANVLEVSQLWRDVVTEVGRDYPEVHLSHMYVDNCAMQLIRNPRQFDVIVTGNMFGDILSDEASMLGGSIGLLPSASIGGKNALYEPIHGSAPDIAGRGIANPLAMILSAAMMLDLSFNLKREAGLIEEAVRQVLKAGHLTADLAASGTPTVGTEKMGDLVVQKLEELYLGPREA